MSLHNVIMQDSPHNHSQRKKIKQQGELPRWQGLRRGFRRRGFGGKGGIGGEGCLGVVLQRRQVVGCAHAVPAAAPADAEEEEALLGLTQGPAAGATGGPRTGALAQRQSVAAALSARRQPNEEPPSARHTIWREGPR